VKRLAFASKSLIVDVDQTVCDLTEMWLNWLAEQTGVEKDPFSLENYKLVNYDLTSYWKDELKELSIDGWDFWRKRDIYDGINLMPWSVDVLEGLNELGYEIAFLSFCKGYHNFSKVNLLKRSFSFPLISVTTKEKWFIGRLAKAVIDDRNYHLQSMPEHVKLIRKTTPFTQEVELTRPCLDYSWTQGIHKLVEYIES